MSEEDGGTITPDVQLKESQERLTEEQDRLLKLYDAYEIQEKEKIVLLFLKKNLLLNQKRKYVIYVVNI